MSSKQLDLDVSGILDTDNLNSITDDGFPNLQLQRNNNDGHHHANNPAIISQSMIDPAIGGVGEEHDGTHGYIGQDMINNEDNRLRLALQQHNAAITNKRNATRGNEGISRVEDTNRYNMFHSISSTIASPAARRKVEDIGIEEGGDGRGGINASFSLGPNGEPIDPKKTCPFCGRSFSHPGSLGRHLDLKKGTRLHPASKVDLIRGNVKRRGDAQEIKQRRATRAKMYNSREDVKERAKIRRRNKERLDKARDMARINFIQKLGFPSIFNDESVSAVSAAATAVSASSSPTPPIPSFAAFVVYFLPTSQWPYDNELPSEHCYNQLCQIFQQVISPIDPVNSTLYRTRLDIAYDEWCNTMNENDKREAWQTSFRRVLAGILGSPSSITAYDIGTRNTWLAIEEDRILSSEGNLNIDGKSFDGDNSDSDERENNSDNDDDDDDGGNNSTRNSNRTGGGIHHLQSHDGGGSDGGRVSSVVAFANAAVTSRLN